MDSNSQATNAESINDDDINNHRSANDEVLTNILVTIISMPSKMINWNTIKGQKTFSYHLLFVI